LPIGWLPTTFFRMIGLGTIGGEVRKFDVASLTSPVSHAELNPIEIVWATVKGVLRRENLDFSMSRLQELVDQEFQHITAEA